MKITLIIGEDTEKIEIPGKTTIKGLLDLIDLPSETVVVKKNNEIVIEEEFIQKNDVIEVIKVIYGG
jgi:sulfur carrier protein